MKAPYVPLSSENTPASDHASHQPRNTLRIAWTAVNIITTIALIAYSIWFFSLREEQTINAAQTLPSDAVAGSGALGGVRYLSSQKINMEPEKFEQLAKILCDGMDSGSNGTSMTNAVEQGIDGLTRFDAVTIMATSVVYTCPEHIGKIGR